jgi:cobalt-zinc-cadmium efflux system outer membrane protein
MFLVRFVPLCALAAFVIGGCRSAPQTIGRPSIVTPADMDSAKESSPQAKGPEIATTAYEEPLPPSTEPVKSDSAKPAELSLQQLIAEVQNRNPSVQAMAAAWQAAAQRYPQAVSLDDPMFSATTAPASFSSDDVEAAYALQAGQKFPWFGKRAARGRIAQAETNAAFNDLEDSRIRLAEATQVAFYEYYLAHRQLDLNGENTNVIRRFRETTQSRYRSNQVTQQDVLQADLELAQQERRKIELARSERIAIARINTLLHEIPDASLPPPPRQLAIPSVQMNRESLQQLALEQRPDLRALAAKVRAEQAAVALACKNYYPDVEVFGRYDTFWQPAETQGDLRGQVGVNVNVPIYVGRLNAAVREAMFRVSQRRAEYEQRRLDIQLEVATAYEELEESRRTFQLFGERLIPAAEQNVSAARSNYDVNKTSFLDLATAQRQLITLREEREMTLALYHKRLAELTRVTGGTVATEMSFTKGPEVLLPNSE